MKLIAYVGPKGSGKDTCALIAKQAGIVAGKIPFAGPLKRICSDVFGINASVFEHPVLKEEVSEYTLSVLTLNSIIAGMDLYIPMTFGQTMSAHTLFHKHFAKTLTSPRHILQYVGTEMIRSFAPDWHCRAAFSPLHLEQLNIVGVELAKTYAVTDCRFMNEFEFLSNEHDTKFHYVLRPDAEAVLATATHPSELEIVSVRQHIFSTIDNSGCLQQLTDEVLGGYL